MSELVVDEVSMRFGGIMTLDGLSFTIGSGLIGPNGAGKTTLFNCVGRIYQPSAGSIRLDSTELLDVPAHKIAGHGVARTFQNLGLFPSLTFLENTMAGAYARDANNRFHLPVTAVGVGRRPSKTDSMTVLIVGASVAGVRTAQALRMAGYGDAITLVGDEVHVPYDKPPLSKEMILRDGPPAPVPLVAEADLAALDLDLRLGVAAVSLDARSRLVTLADGAQVSFDHLVIATGVRPRTLPGAEGLAGVHTIRSADDAAALRAALGGRPRVVVIGAGFIGAEFASAAVGHGASVSIIEAQSVPLSHVLGEDVGGELARLHSISGVHVETDARFGRFTGDDHVTGVELADGRVLPADLVVVGIGAVPNTEWLASSGLPIDDGVLCDATLQVVGWPGIYAAGDVAHWRHSFYDTEMRIEHWTNANEHASLVAAGITGGEPPRPQVPYVWSDQYGHRIQIVGRPASGSVAFSRGAVSADKYAAVYADDEGVVVGAVVLDDPRTLMKCRKAVTRRQPVEALELDLAPTTS